MSTIGIYGERTGLIDFLSYAPTDINKFINDQYKNFLVLQQLLDGKAKSTGILFSNEIIGSKFLLKLKI